MKPTFTRCRALLLYYKTRPQTSISRIFSNSFAPILLQTHLPVPPHTGLIIRDPPVVIHTGMKHANDKTTRWLPLGAPRWLILAAPICAVIGIGCAQPQRGRWFTDSLPPYPTPITNNAVTSVCDSEGCTIYSFMGMTRPNDSASITPKSYKLASPGADTWEPIADAPLLDGRAKIAASAVICAERIYLIGGYTVEEDGREVSEKRFFQYDPNRNTYLRLADVPIEVDDTVVGVYRDRFIYLISGWHGPAHENTQAIQVYDTKSDTWRQATPIPTDGRFGHAGGLVANRLVLIDGCTHTEGYPLQHDTWVGVIDHDDCTKIKWQNRGPSPFKPTYRAANASGLHFGSSGLHAGPGILRVGPVSNRSSHPSGLHPGAGILFVGGTDNPYNYNGTGYNSEPSEPLDQVMIYEPIADRWRRIHTTSDPDRQPTMDHRGIVFFNGSWVTIGGMTSAGQATNAAHALRIDDSMRGIGAREP